MIPVRRPRSHDPWDDDLNAAGEYGRSRRENTMQAAYKLPESFLNRADFQRSPKCQVTEYQTINDLPFATFVLDHFSTAPYST